METERDNIETERFDDDLIEVITETPSGDNSTGKEPKNTINYDDFKYSPADAAKRIGVSKTTIFTYMNDFKEYLSDHIIKKGNGQTSYNFLDDTAVLILEKIIAMKRDQHYTSEEIKSIISNEEFIIMSEPDNKKKLQRYLQIREASIDKRLQEFSENINADLSAMLTTLQTMRGELSVQLNSEIETKMTAMLSSLVEKNSSLAEENSKLKEELLKQQYENQIKDLENKVLQEESQKKELENKLLQEESQKKKSFFTFFHK